MNKNNKTNNKDLTVKQKRVVKGIIENIGKSKPKPIGKIIKESGYSDSVVHNPQVITQSKTIKRELEPFIDKLDKVRNMALNTINQAKLDKSTAKDLSSITSTLTKDHQLLTGQSTANISGNLSLSDLYEQSQKE